MLITDARQALQDQAGLDRVRELTGELQQVLQGLMARQPGEGGAGPGDAGPGPGPGQAAGDDRGAGPDDDVIDADFTPR